MCDVTHGMTPFSACKVTYFMDGPNEQQHSNYPIKFGGSQ